MSKISLKPADTGTATFTLEAPATNTNRTITFPDAGGEIVTTGSVGTIALQDADNVNITGGTVNADTLQQDGSQAYVRDNILGTVSESSGVPTGAIIERGSNANGEFVRYADGTQICMRVISFTTNFTPLGNIQRGTGAGLPTWNFPSPFTTVSSVAVSASIEFATDGVWVGSSTAPTTTSVQFLLYGAVDITKDIELRCVAIGRWY